MPAEHSHYSVQVRSELYDVERWAPMDHIRPRWKRWGTKWRLLEQFQTAKKVSKANGTPAGASKSAAAKAAFKTYPTPNGSSKPQARVAQLGPISVGAPEPAAPAVPKPKVVTAAFKVPGPSAGSGSPSKQKAAGPPPPPPPPLAGTVMERCATVLEWLRSHDEAPWLALPVSAGGTALHRPALLLAS